jgi:hypothetical protein
VSQDRQSAPLGRCRRQKGPVRRQHARVRATLVEVGVLNTDEIGRHLHKLHAMVLICGIGVHRIVTGVSSGRDGAPRTLVSVGTALKEAARMLDGAALRQDTRRPRIATALGVLVAVEATTFLVFGSLHLGLQIPLGFATLREPYIWPAARVETVCCLSLALAAGTMLAGWRHAWLTAVVAHTISIGGVLLGMVALAAGRGPRTESNDIYHLTILLVMLAGLALLATPAARAALRRSR